MSDNNNGGPAFPSVDIKAEFTPDGSHHIRSIPTTTQGMTLRDYFAAKAMNGLLSDLPNSLYGIDWAENTANAAYEVADAMLAAREKGGAA